MKKLMNYYAPEMECYTTSIERGFSVSLEDPNENPSIEFGNEDVIEF